MQGTQTLVDQTHFLELQMNMVHKHSTVDQTKINMYRCKHSLMKLWMYTSTLYHT